MICAQPGLGSECLEAIAQTIGMEEEQQGRRAML